MSFLTQVKEAVSRINTRAVEIVTAAKPTILVESGCKGLGQRNYDSFDAMADAQASAAFRLGEARPSFRRKADSKRRKAGPVTSGNTGSLSRLRERMLGSASAA